MKTIRYILTVIFLLHAAPITKVFSQETTMEGERKKVAVVLSGGGAKGVAHIGVLKALEENGIAIDYIAGTSIGAMVGGLYAAGYSPDEIMNLMNSEEFLEASKGRLTSEHDYYFYRTDPTPAWLSFNYPLEQFMNFEQVIRGNIPSNIVSPGIMDFMFMQYLGPASGRALNNFDSLFVPFRCIASDITNKKAVVMRHGNLAEAVRASMTFPFYFKPILIDSTLLFDGGMFNNFPADIVMEDFHPDIIIGSVVATNPAPPSVNDLLSQVTNMLMVHSNYGLPAGAEGIILHPPVPDIGVTDFSHNTEIYALGYKTVIENLDSIKGFNPGTCTQDNLKEMRQSFTGKYKSGRIGGVQWNTHTGESGEFARAFLMPRGAEITMSQLRENYYRLLSLQKYRHIYPRLHYQGDTDLFHLELEVQRNYALTRRFGGNLSSQSINQFFGMFEYEKLAEHPLTLYSNFFVGNNYNSFKAGLRVDFLHKRPFYLMAETSASRWNFAGETLFLFEEQKPSFIIQNEYLNEVRLVFPSGYQGKWELGGIYTYTKNRYYNTGYFTNNDTTDLTVLHPLGLYLSREINTLDHCQYPSRGKYLKIRARYFNGWEEYIPGTTSFRKEASSSLHNWWELGMKWEKFFFHKSKLRPSFMGEMMFSNRPLMLNYSASRILAPQYSPFPIATTRYLDNFRANQYLAAGVKTVLLINRSLMLQGEAHVFQPLKQILPDTEHYARYMEGFDNPQMMYHAALVLHTPVGPLSAGISYYEREPDPFSFIINFGYILHNRRTF